MRHPDPSRLLYCRQFVLGPRPLAEYAHWRTTFVGPHLVLQVHQDLPLVQVSANGLHLTLLGFAIDPLDPGHDDEDILTAIAHRIENAHQAPRAAENLSGRWVMIVDDGSDQILFHDPCGLREAYHTTWDHPETWVASQPDRFAKALGLEVGAQQREFLDSAYYRENEEAWMPSPACAYPQVHHLTANHYLDLRTREVKRYWPHRPLKELDLEEGAHLAAQILRESLRGAHRRFRLALPLTAGMDSRTLLAATRGLDRIWHYTGCWGGPDRNAIDIDTARNVLSIAGRSHHVLRCPYEMTDEFANIYLANTWRARPGVGAIAEGLMAGFPEGHVQINGHCSEIVRDTFGITHEKDVTAEALAGLMNMRGNPYCIDQIDLWLEEASRVCERTGYRAWDLFFMEQEYGVWAADGQSQWDLVHDRFTPFNHRGVLSALMGVDPRWRQGPGYEAHRRMIEILWPELLAEPFNPSSPSLGARSRIMFRKMRERGVRGTLSSGIRRLMPV